MPKKAIPPPVTPTSGMSVPDSGVPDPKSDPKKEQQEEIDKIEKLFKGRLKTSKKHRKTFIAEWKQNIETRLGHANSAIVTGVGIDESEDEQEEVNPDWSLTKSKTANLFSQVPQVQGTHEHKQYAQAVAPFMKSLNYEIGDKRANAGAAMEEAMNDLVNASGFGAIYIGYSAFFETVKVPAIDPQALQAQPPEVQQLLNQPGKMPMKDSEVVADYKFYMNRISPADALWPKEFVDSDFNEADYVGNSGTHPWSISKNEFQLEDEDQEKVLISTGEKPDNEDLRSSEDKSEGGDLKMVKFDQLFYWRHRVDPECTSFSEIWRIVFVEGKEHAVIHGPWKGQKRNSKGKIVGSTKFPIQFGTLTYITDHPIPPSDSRAMRPQVLDMRRSRSQMFENRDRSFPIRWYDVNRLDTTVQDSIMKGTYQGWFPMNGDGGRAIGEIARASYPSEDFTFDQENKQDLIEGWNLQPSATPMGGQPGGRITKAEQQANQQNFATRIGQERGRVAQFFLNCVEVLAGLMALYSDFPILTDQEKQQMQQSWNDKEILADLVLKIRPDSAIVLDTSSRLDRIFKFINLTVKSGFVNPQPLIMEACELSGFDPTEVIIQPQPKPPDEATVSLRLTGKEDLLNPVALAMLLKQRKITPQELDEAKMILEKMQEGVMPPEQAGPGAPAHAGGPAHPGAPPHPPGGAPGVPIHPSQPPANDAWKIADKVAKRSRDASGD